MKMRRWIGRGAALACLVTTTALGRADDGPRLKDAVGFPPIEAVNGAPFDVARLFQSPPPGENAAPLYLDALFEFSPEMADAFPEGPERDRRREVAAGRVKAFAVATPATADAVVNEHREGFRKLAEAQTRDRCVFETGLGVTATLAHVKAARHVARVAALKASRALQRGDIDGAIADIKMTLRLARDLQPRGHLISQLVSVAITTVVVRTMAVPTLAAPGLTPEHCDRIAAALADHEARSIDVYSESLKMEYVSTRITLLDLIHHQDKVARAMDLKPGESVIKKLFNVTTVGPAPGKEPPQAKVGPGGPTFPEDIDTRVANTTPVELDQAVGRLNAFYTAVLALADRTALERLARAPAAWVYFGGDEVFDRVTRELQPSVAAAVQAFARNDATLRAAECLAAVRRWQLTHDGAAPVDLAAACRAAGLKGVPADPYDGRPMRLAIVDGAPVVYSIGKDGHDDGGVDSDYDRKPGDQVHRLPAGAGR